MTTNTEEPRLNDLNRVASRLSCTRRHVEKLIASGRLASIHIGRRHLVEEGELRRFIASLQPRNAA